MSILKMQRFFIFILLICCASAVSAQVVDSATVVQPQLKSEIKAEPLNNDSVKVVKPVWMTPKKIALFSGILPGLGQAYNHQYWKIPIIYAGFGVAGYFIASNLKDYNAFRQIYAGRISGDYSVDLKYPGYANYSIDVIKNARDGTRKNLDITVLVTALVYGLQMIDALVYAQLKNFDISPDISFHTKAVTYPRGGVGIGLVMNF